MPSAGGYLAVFRAEGARPEPDAIRACRIDRSSTASPGSGATDDMPD
jgi:hypothetical protein